MIQKNKSASKKADQIKNLAADTSDSREQITYHGEKFCYKISEAASLLSISTNSLRRLIKRKEIKANDKLRHILITRQELINFLNLEGCSK